MLALEVLLALQFSTSVTVGIAIALLLAVALWGPYLFEEIVRGKARVGPRSPAGAGDTHPGRRGDPAPGQPDAQADPYEPRTQR